MEDQKIDKESSTIHCPESSSSGTASLSDKEWATHPSNARTWSRGQKAYQAFVVVMMTLLIYSASSIYVPAQEYVAQDFGVGLELSILPLPIMTLGIAFGSLIGSPLSEVIGRLPIYWTTMPLSVVFLVGSGVSHTYYGIVICRFFAGLFGGAVTTVGPGGTIADMYFAQGRITPLNMVVGAAFASPPIALLIGGYTLQCEESWRWTVWITLMLAAITLPCMVALRETNERAIRRRLELNGSKIHQARDLIRTLRRQVDVKLLLRPIWMLISKPVASAIGVYTSFAFGIVYGMLTTVPYIFSKLYGFSLGAIGFSWLSWAVGFGVAALACSLGMHRAASRSPKGPDGAPAVQPEAISRLGFVGSPLVPIALFWIAWTARPDIHYMVPIVGMGFYAMGVYLTFVSGSIYLIQYYGPEYGASAVGGVRLAGALFGTAFPLFMIQMLENLGIGWGISLLGFIAVALVPIPFVLCYLGPRLRGRSQYKE